MEDTSRRLRTYHEKSSSLAKIKVRGDKNDVPEEVEVTSDGITFTISVWCEVVVTVRISHKRTKERGK